MRILSLEERNVHRYTFPIRTGVVNGRGRFMDASGKPFLWHADTSWKLFWEFTFEEAARYLRDRARKGFTVILVHMLPHRIHKCNRNGDLPFKAAGVVGECNDVYFDYVGKLIEYGRELGIAFAVAPMWLSTWEQDWYKYYAGEECRKYSEYISKKFAGFDNIIAWIHGGDDDAPGLHEDIRINAGIFKKNAPNILSTYHAGIRGSWGFFGKESWYDFCFAYTYNYETFLMQLEEAIRDFPEKPVILGETHYEGNEKIDAAVIRKYAYTSLFLGGAGHTYGNKEIWMYTMFWENALNSECSTQMTLLRELAEQFNFEELCGDFSGDEISTVRSIMPDAKDSVIPYAISADGKKMLAYLDDFRWFTPGKRWKRLTLIDPVSGRCTVAESVFDRVYQLSGKNAGGGYDRILYFEAELGELDEQ